jgi:subtilisin family serine protease
LLFVAAAGNDSVDTDIEPYYPACHSLPNIISVTAIGRTGDLCDWEAGYGSNWGITTVHIAAPGDEILSTIPGTWELLEGTSMAAAHVSGVAGLLLATDPTLTPIELRDVLLANVQPHPSLEGWVATGGIVNAYMAVSAVIQTGVPPRNIPPGRAVLHQNVPNPFNPVTEITFSLTTPSHVTLAVYDVAGRLVEVLATGQMPEGGHKVTWEGRGIDGLPMASGVYFYQLCTGEFEETRKMVLLR